MKKVHKWLPESLSGEKRAACKVHNKTMAFKSCVLWEYVTCELCLRKKK